MAKRIVKTPDLTGKEAEKFIAMHTDTILTSSHEQLLKSYVEVYRKHKN